MSFHIFTDGFDQSIDQVTMRGSYDSAESASVDVRMDWGYASFSEQSETLHFDDTANSFDRTVTVGRDRVMKFRAVGNDGTGERFGSTIFLKTFCAGSSFSTPASSAVTQISATVSCDINPSTVESGSTVIVEYRVSGEVPLQETSVIATLAPGAGTTTCSTTLLGLTPGLTYEYRFRLDRDTSNDPQSWSAFATFAAVGGAVTAVTNPASSIGSAGATLNGTVNAGGQANITYKFEYGLTTAYGSSTPAVAITGAQDEAVAANISGLTLSTTYHFRVVGLTGATPTNGADATFVTLATPAATSAEDEDVIFHAYAQYGVSTVIYFTLKEPSATNSDRFITAAAPFVAGDVKISKDGGALANVTNLPVQVASAQYSWTPTAAEMQCIKAQIFLIDQNGPVWRDAIIRIETTLALGNLLVVNPNGNGATISSSGGNGNGIHATGNGTGSGWLGTAGGTGAICNFFDTLEGAEPTGAIGNSASFKQILQYLKRRFFNRHEQTSALQTMKKDDSTTNLQTAVSSDDGTTQTIQKYI